MMPYHSQFHVNYHTLPKHTKKSNNIWNNENAANFYHFSLKFLHKVRNLHYNLRIVKVPNFEEAWPVQHKAYLLLSLPLSLAKPFTFGLLS